MAGLDGSSSGEILLDGYELSELDEEQRAILRGQLVGFVFQSFQLLPSLTALENVMLPIELKGDAQAREKAVSLLERVGLEERWHHYPNQLSGGEQQRVAIARAFATKARILFADEPTGNLDKKNALKMMSLFQKLNTEKKLTIIIATHDEDVFNIGHKKYQLVDGCLELVH